MSLRTRLTISLNSLLLVTVVLVSGLTLFTTVQSLRENARRSALGTASLLASAATTTLGAPGEVQQLVQKVIDAGDLEAIFVVNSEGRLVASSSPTGKADLVKEYYDGGLDAMAMATKGSLRPMARFRGGSVEACVPLAVFGGKAGALICRLSTRELDRAISSSLRDIIALSLAGLIAGALLASVLAKRISGPIHALAEASRVIGAGGFHHRVKVTTGDEVGLLADSFNTMAHSLETYTAELTRTTSEKKALARELDIAAGIQRSLLPQSCPEIAGFDAAARSIPAREVGGDFYDFIPLPENRWGAVIADVSGKGVPAALLMALSRSLIRAYSREKPSILDALRLANRFMLNDMPSGMFVTCFYAVIDPKKRTLTYVNAGHNPPLVTRLRGQVVMLPASGTPLGVLDESGMEEQTCELSAGDVVVMYTDGITDAMDAQGERFGMARLGEVARNSGHLPAGEILERLFAAVNMFAASQPQFDDMTAIVLGVL